MSKAEFLFIIGPLSVLVSGRVWNIELWGFHLYGVGWCPWGFGAAG